MIRMKTMLLALCGLLVLTSLGYTSLAYAKDPDGRYAQSQNKSWFQNWQNKIGGSCCGAADCHLEAGGAFKWRQSPTGEGYQVLILPSQTWITVTDDRLPKAGQAPNPTNGALACWAPGQTTQIYCFEPPADPGLPPDFK